MSKLPKMETRQMLKCEACGGFHTEEESEIVVIKIVKGKQCELKSLLAPSVTTSFKPAYIPVVDNNSDIKENIVPSVFSTVKQEQEVLPTKRKVPLPPGMVAMFTPGGNPGEATEKRMV